MTDTDVAVADAADRARYEATVDGQLAAFAEYRADTAAVTFTHTEVLPGFAGRGISSVLVRRALDDVRAQHKSVVPVCRFVASYLDKHAAEYGDLLRPG